MTHITYEQGEHIIALLQQIADAHQPHTITMRTTTRNSYPLDQVRAELERRRSPFDDVTTPSELQ